MLKYTDLSQKLKLKTAWPLHIMLIPSVILIIIFAYIPMVGIVISFQDFIPTRGMFGSPWLGLENYKTLFMMPGISRIIRNTIVISIVKIVSLQLFSIFFAVMLNEIINKHFRKVVQSIVFFPFFLSWVILSGIIVDVFSLRGVINQIILLFSDRAVFFLGDNKWFRVLLYVTNIWKEFGYTIIIYLAAITGIDDSLYGVAEIDGANRLQQTWHITLTSIRPTIVLLLFLALGGILNAGFEQIFNLYNTFVVESSEIIDTYVYKLGLVSRQYSLATAVGLLKSVVGFVMISISFWLSSKFANYRII